MRRYAVLVHVFLMSLDQLALQLRHGCVFNFCQRPLLVSLLRNHVAYARLPFAERLGLLNLDDLHVCCALLVVIGHQQYEARVIIVEELGVRDLLIGVRLELEPRQFKCR